jgi:taurine dioxygenase
MQITKLSEHIGVEVTGIDLRQPTDGAMRQQLMDALVENVAMVIRDQDFTAQQYLATVQLFGEVMDQHFTQNALPDCPLVHEVSNQRRDKSGKRDLGGTGWHTDHTNHRRPPKFTSLYAIKIPSRGGNTAVCNMRAGYTHLPDDIKQRINGMKTSNVFMGSAAVTSSLTSVAAQAETQPEPVLQPLVRTNPDNGTKAVYFHPTKTENIIGMDPESTQELLSELLSHTVKPAFIYSHKWRKGDMLIWDNRSALHRGEPSDNPDEPRLLYRALVRGELPH